MKARIILSLRAAKLIDQGVTIYLQGRDGQLLAKTG
ncbi:hypothetical protein J2T49_001166 [Pseudomonas nitroreducens]|nr:hypothetical protein [Pseudomonas nitroreducens]MCP1685227.1 hypothetical protein [Pseudomonas nitroreducens]